MKKSGNNSTKKILIIILALVIGSFIGYRFALAQTSNSLKSVVEPGSMTSEASYVIFTDGTNYYARNGTTGEIEFSGMNATQVIQNAIDNCKSSPADVYIAGNISFSGTILINAILHPQLSLTFETLTETADADAIVVDGGASWTYWIGTIKGHMLLTLSPYSHAAVKLRNVANGRIDIDYIAVATQTTGSACVELLGDGSGCFFNQITVSNTDGGDSAFLLRSNDTGGFVNSNTIYGGEAVWCNYGYKVISTNGANSNSQNNVYNLQVEGLGAGQYGFYLTAGVGDCDGTTFVGCSTEDVSTIEAYNVYVGASQIATFLGGQFVNGNFSIVGTAHFVDVKGLVTEYSGSWSGTSPVYIPNPLDPRGFASDTANIFMSIAVNSTQPYSYSYQVNSSYITIYHNAAGNLTGTYMIKWGH